MVVKTIVTPAGDALPRASSAETDTLARQEPARPTTEPNHCSWLTAPIETPTVSLLLSITHEQHPRYPAPVAPPASPNGRLPLPTNALSALSASSFVSIPTCANA